MPEFKFKEKKSKYPGVQVRMSWEQYDDLRQIAVKENSTIGEVVKVIFFAGLEEYKKWQAKH